MTEAESLENLESYYEAKNHCEEEGPFKANTINGKAEAESLDIKVEEDIPETFEEPALENTSPEYITKEVPISCQINPVFSSETLSEKETELRESLRAETKDVDFFPRKVSLSKLGIIPTGRDVLKR